MRIWDYTLGFYLDGWVGGGVGVWSDIIKTGWTSML